jgi:aryl-alcohol dehydrogenase-like predicted oxidoreductase
MLDGKYTAETTFDKDDHRSHRPKEWLVNGLKKLEQLRFLHEGADRTIGQAAIQYILDSWPCVTSVLPNIYDAQQLREFAEAPDTPSLTVEEIARVNALYECNFGLERAQEAATTAAAVGARHASPGGAAGR